MNEQEFTLENFIKVIDFFQSQPLVLQIVILLFLTGITVGAIIFSYYMVKLVVVFFIKLVKVGVTVVKAGVEYKPEPEKVMKANHFARSPYINATIISNGLNSVQNTSSGNLNFSIQNQRFAIATMNVDNLDAPIQNQRFSYATNNSGNGSAQQKIPIFHCTNCGNAFSEKMMEAIRQHEKVYCEFCGQGFVVEK